MNNWNIMNLDKMKAVIVIKIPQDVENLKLVETERNVYLYKGGISLKDFQWGHGTFEE